MALQDILNSIQQEAEQQITEIKHQVDVELQAAKQEWAVQLQARSLEVRARLQSEIESRKLQELRKLKGAGQKAILLAKQKQLDRVFSEGLARLAQLSVSVYVDLMARLIAGAPDQAGELISVKGKSAWLKKAVNKAQSKWRVVAEEMPGSGGFVFRSKSLTVDNRFENLLDSMKDDLRVEVGKILFNFPSLPRRG